MTATATDPYAQIKVELGETEIENGSAATWEDGDNTLTITVTGGSPATVYTVTVTKSTAPADDNTSHMRGKRNA